MDMLKVDVTSAWNYISADFTLTNIGWWFKTFGIFGVAVPIGLYLYSQRKEKADRMRRSCEAIMFELKDNQDAFEPGKYPVTTYNYKSTANSGAIHTTSENPIKFTKVYLNADAYKSILYSGLLTYFLPETQHLLAELYGRIQDHNEYIKQVGEFEDQYLLDPESETRRRWMAKVRRYHRFLSDIEAEMVVLFEGVQRSLEKERAFIRL